MRRFLWWVELQLLEEIIWYRCDTIFEVTQLKCRQCHTGLVEVPRQLGNIYTKPFQSGQENLSRPRFNCFQVEAFNIYGFLQQIRNTMLRLPVNINREKDDKILHTNPARTFAILKGCVHGYAGFPIRRTVGDLV